MYWDLLDWYMVWLAAVQLFFLYVWLKICEDREFRKMVEFLLRHGSENFADIGQGLRIVIYTEIVVSALLVSHRYFK